MPKILVSIILTACLSVNLYAQDTTREKSAAVIDTASLLAELMDLLDSAASPVSYGLVSVGIGNRLFSLRNNQLNAKQATTATMVYSPALGYYHKSGFSLSAGANFLNEKKKGFGATQFSVTPAFDLLTIRNWALGISYSHYFISDRFSAYASPVQNDLYAYVTYKKTWLEPGVAMGFSNGNFTEILKLTGPNGNVFTDTGVYHIRSFSMMATVSHDFEWSAVLGKSDALSFSPALQMNFSSDSTNGVSHTIGQNLVRLLSRRRRFAKLQTGNSFQAQSVAMSLDLNYAIGKLTVLPQLYLDYYLPDTDEKRLTQTFTLSVGYTF